ncbi:MAG: hypothetical protein ACRC46_09445 [Thermoguttaceae bacterium]
MKRVVKIVALVCVSAAVSANVQGAPTACQPVRVTTYKKVLTTEYVPQEVTTYETVWVDEQRERRTTVARQVPETQVREERVTVQKPVWETQYRDESYDVTRQVPETQVREERYVVPRQVYETQERNVVENRTVPVTETVLQENRYTVQRPVTTYESQMVDRGQTVETIRAQAPKTYTRLVWQRAGEQYDPDTQTTRWQAPGFRWKEMTAEPTYEVQKVYRPSWVQEYKPVTTFVAEDVVQQFPVTQTSYRTEQVVRKEAVQVPVTTYKTIYEEIVEPYTVRVAKVVPVTRTVNKPVQVERVVPVSYTTSGTTTTVIPASYTPADRTTVQRIETRIVPTEPLLPLTDIFISRPITTTITPSPVTTSTSPDPADTTPVIP